MVPAAGRYLAVTRVAWPIRRILLALSARHSDAAHRGLNLDELREIGWPGERMQTEAAANRVHVALAELRRRGLKAFIVRQSQGYAFSERLAVLRSEVPSPSDREPAPLGGVLNIGLPLPEPSAPSALPLASRT